MIDFNAVLNIFNEHKFIDFDISINNDINLSMLLSDCDTVMKTRTVLTG